MTTMTDVMLERAPVYSGGSQIDEVRAALATLADAGLVSVSVSQDAPGLEALTYEASRMIYGVRCQVTVLSLYRVGRFPDAAAKVKALLADAGWVLEPAAVEITDPEAFYVTGAGLDGWVDGVDERRGAEVVDAFALTARLGVGRVAPTSNGADVVFTMSEMTSLLARWGVA